MTPATQPAERPRRSLARGEATRARVLDAAEKCVYELGFNRASSSEVMRQSGLTFGVIQYHFGTYEAVLLAVVERAGARLRDMLEHLEFDDATSREKLERIADTVWEYFSRPQYLSYLEIYVNLLRDPATSEQTLRSIRAIDAEIEDQWREILARVIGTGEDEIAIQRLLFGAMRGMAVSRRMNDGRIDFTRERAIFVEMLADYLERHLKSTSVSVGGAVAPPRSTRRRQGSRPPRS